MRELEERVRNLEREVRELTDKLKLVRTPPHIIATPGKRLTLNEHFNVVDWVRKFESHTHE